MARNTGGRNLARIKREIEDKKKRRSLNYLPTDKWDAFGRIRSIRSSISKYPEETELCRHAIVAGVAALQSYHRDFLSDVMQGDPELRLKAAEMIGEKYSLADTLRYIGNEQLSAEELIAHAAPANSIGDLIIWLDHIFGKEFKRLLSEAVPPAVRKNPELSVPIVENVDELLSTLGEMFEKRHILAHEAAPQYEISREEALRSLDAVEKWMDATEGVLWRTVLIDEPFTQAEMNFHSADKYNGSRIRLAKVLSKCRGLLDRKQKNFLFENHQAWKCSTVELGNMSFGRLEGTLWPSVHAEMLAVLFDARSNVLEEWADFLDL